MLQGMNLDKKALENLDQVSRGDPVVLVSLEVHQHCLVGPSSWYAMKSAPLDSTIPKVWSHSQQMVRNLWASSPTTPENFRGERLKNSLSIFYYSSGLALAATMSYAP